MEIGPWKRIDDLWLRGAVRRFLQAGIARGGDLLATDKNVKALCEMGYAAAERGEPCFTGVIAGVPVGFLFWTTIPNTLDSRWKTLHALGSYTEPKYRSLHVARDLRLAGLEWAKSSGFERIIGPVHATNTRGIEVFCTKFGAWPTTIQFEVLL